MNNLRRIFIRISEPAYIWMVVYAGIAFAIVVMFICVSMILIRRKNGEMSNIVRDTYAVNDWRVIKQ